MDVNDYLYTHNSFNGVKTEIETDISFPYLDIVSTKKTHTVEIDFFRKTLPDLPLRLLIQYIIIDLCQGKYIGSHGTWCMGKFRSRERLIKCCHCIEYLWTNMSELSVIDDLMQAAQSDYKKIKNELLFND
jgi:hypothetical protein